MSEDRSTTGVRAADVVGAVFATLLVGSLLVYVFVPRPFVTRTPGHRNVCSNNLRQIGIAMLNYESSQKSFPGYANPLNSSVTGYIVPLLPYLERSDLHRAWMDNSDVAARPTPFLEMLVCPSDPPADRKSPWLAYVVNSGEAGRENAADGICFDQTQPGSPTVSLSDVFNKDGASNTVLLTENLQAETWTVKNAAAARAWTTFVWHKEVPVDANWTINSLAMAGAPKLTFSRPSCKHTRGVNVLFCDGHSRFIADSIDYNVYRQLMTPDGANSRDPVNRAIKDGEY